MFKTHAVISCTARDLRRLVSVCEHITRDTQFQQADSAGCRNTRIDREKRRTPGAHPVPRFFPIAVRACWPRFLSSPWRPGAPKQGRWWTCGRSFWGLIFHPPEFTLFQKPGLCSKIPLDRPRASFPFDGNHVRTCDAALRIPIARLDRENGGLDALCLAAAENLA